MKYLKRIIFSTSISLILFSQSVVAQQEGAEYRAARVCAGVRDQKIVGNGTFEVDGVTVKGNTNGTYNLSQNGVDLGNIEKPKTYAEYTTCLSTVMDRINSSEKKSSHENTSHRRVAMFTSQFDIPDETPIGNCDCVSVVNGLATIANSDQRRYANGSSLRITNKCASKIRLIIQVDSNAESVRSLPFVPDAGRLFVNEEMDNGETIIADMSGQNTVSRTTFSFPGCPNDHFHLPPGVLAIPKSAN